MWRLAMITLSIVLTKSEFWLKPLRLKHVFLQPCNIFDYYISIFCNYLVKKGVPRSQVLSQNYSKKKSIKYRKTLRK